MERTPTKSLLQLHAAMLIFGFAAVLGDLINLPATALVFWRLLITVVSLPLLINIATQVRKTSAKSIWYWASIGVIVCLHWVLFFESIKLSNASVTLVCLATVAVFTAFLEPLIMRHRPNISEVVLAILVVPCMMLVVRDLDFSMRQGVWAGLLSAFLLALFGIFNKKTVDKGHPIFITFVELSSGFACIAIYLFVFGSVSWKMIIPTGMDWVYLTLLALGCTTLGYVLVLYALKHLSAFTASLAFNLEPVYGMILAYLLLDDGGELSLSFYIGGILMILLIFGHSVAKQRMTRKASLP